MWIFNIWNVESNSDSQPSAKWGPGLDWKGYVCSAYQARGIVIYCIITIIDIVIFIIYLLYLLINELP